MSENNFYNKFSNKKNSAISKQENFIKFLGVGTKWGLYGHIISLLIPLEILLYNFLVGMVFFVPFLLLILCDIQGIKDEKEQKKTNKIYGLNIPAYNNRFTLKQWCHNMHIIFPIEERQYSMILGVVSLLCFATGISLMFYIDFPIINVFLFFVIGIGCLCLLGLGIYVKKGKYVYPWILEQEQERKKMKENKKLKQKINNHKRYREKISEQQIKTSKELQMFGLNYDNYNKENLKKAWVAFIKTHHPDRFPEQSEKFLQYKNVYEELLKQFKS